jgi:hypothetical protein
VVKCCPGVCTAEELYRAEAPVFNDGGTGGCQASNDTCADCDGTSNWCLQSRKHWNPSHTCENSKKWCSDTKWGKDMQECCPGVCNTAANETGACQLTGCSASEVRAPTAMITPTCACAKSGGVIGVVKMLATRDIATTRAKALTCSLAVLGCARHKSTMRMRVSVVALAAILLN